MSKKYNQFVQHHERRPTWLWLHADIGATGAPTLDTGKSQGISSIVRDATGQYTITLKEKYNRLMGLSAALVDTADSDVYKVEIEADNVSAATPTLQVQCFDSAAAAVDPADGSDLLLTLILSDAEEIGS